MGESKRIWIIHLIIVRWKRVEKTSARRKNEATKNLPINLCCWWQSHSMSAFSICYCLPVEFFKIDSVFPRDSDLPNQCTANWILHEQMRKILSRMLPGKKYLFGIFDCRFHNVHGSQSILHGHIVCVSISNAWSAIV